MGTDWGSFPPRPCITNAHNACALWLGLHAPIFGISLWPPPRLFVVRCCNLHSILPYSHSLLVYLINLRNLPEPTFSILYKPTHLPPPAIFPSSHLTHSFSQTTTFNSPVYTTLPALASQQLETRLTPQTKSTTASTNSSKWHPPQHSSLHSLRQPLSPPLPSGHLVPLIEPHPSLPHRVWLLRRRRLSKRSPHTELSKKTALPSWRARTEGPKVSLHMRRK